MVKATMQLSRGVRAWTAILAVTLLGSAFFAASAQALPATFWGAISTVLALFVVGVIISKPSVFGAFSFASVASLVVIFISGPIIYTIARRMRLSSSSIDMRLAMRELPPE